MDLEMSNGIWLWMEFKSKLAEAFLSAGGQLLFQTSIGKKHSSFVSFSYIISVLSSFHPQTVDHCSTFHVIMSDWHRKREKTVRTCVRRMSYLIECNRLKSKETAFGTSWIIWCTESDRNGIISFEEECTFSQKSGCTKVPEPGRERGIEREK